MRYLISVRPMLLKLQLTDFKSFADATVRFAPITTLVGTNASGKSNILDALKFLHGVGRGYTIAEIFGGKTAFGGRVWEGIRGGPAGAARFGKSEFGLQFEFKAKDANSAVSYQIRISVNGKGPRVVAESLYENEQMLFDSHPAERTPREVDTRSLAVSVASDTERRSTPPQEFPSHQPILSQIAEIGEVRSDPRTRELVRVVNETRAVLGGLRFLDFDPKLMRQPATPGEKTVSESGDNLSSVLHTIVEDHGLGAAIAHWMQLLTPMDVKELKFDEYSDGKILANLIESSGAKVPLSNASDGTLRFLGIVAAVHAPEPPTLLCFEELETGFHPVRLALVLTLLEKATRDGAMQVLTTTHSPQLLKLLNGPQPDSAYLTYRREETADTRICRVADIPHLKEVTERSDLARLLETGWFEDTLFFETEPRA